MVLALRLVTSSWCPLDCPGPAALHLRACFLHAAPDTPPQQRERDAWFLQFLVQLGPLRHDAVGQALPGRATS